MPTKLLSTYPEIKEVNLGNLKKNENRKMITSSVYLNEQELDLVKND